MTMLDDLEKRMLDLLYKTRGTDIFFSISGNPSYGEYLVSQEEYCEWVIHCKVYNRGHRRNREGIKKAIEILTRHLEFCEIIDEMNQAIFRN